MHETIDAPMPCTTRKAISSFSPGASPQASELRPKMAQPAMNIFTLPVYSETFPKKMNRPVMASR